MVKRKHVVIGRRRNPTDTVTTSSPDPVIESTAKNTATVTKPQVTTLASTVTAAAVAITGHMNSFQSGLFPKNSKRSAASIATSSKQSRGAGGRFGSSGRKQMKCYIPFEVKCKCGETRSITTEAEFIDSVGYENAVTKKKN